MDIQIVGQRRRRRAGLYLDFSFRSQADFVGSFRDGEASRVPSSSASFGTMKFTKLER